MRGLNRAAVSVVALVLINAVFAAGASAAQIHSEIEKTFFSGQQVTQNVLSTPAGQLKCKATTLTGTQAGTTASSLMLVPAFSECSAFGQEAKVSVNECHIKVTVTSATGGSYTIENTGACVITVALPSGNCHLTVTAQTPGTPTTSITNQAAGFLRDLLIAWLVSKMEYTVTGPGTICGTAGKHSDGQLTGSITLKGFSDAAHTTQRGIWIE